MNHKRVFLYLVILLFLSFLVKAEANSPQAVFLQPIQVYGKDCDRASDLTTLEFRDGKTKKDWAVQSKTMGLGSGMLIDFMLSPH